MMYDWHCSELRVVTYVILKVENFTCGEFLG